MQEVRYFSPSKNSFSSPVSSIPKRYTRLLFATIFIAGIFFLIEHSRRQVFDITQSFIHDNEDQFANAAIGYPHVKYPETKLTPDNSENLPPLFHAYRQYEDAVAEWNLKQHGKPEDKYIYLSNHAFGAGWGNIMEEVLTGTLLASGSGRGYVWNDYTWTNDGSDYSEFRGKRIPSKVPLSTMIAGYILGLPTSPSLPPSISERVFDRVCPSNERFYIDNILVKEHNGLAMDEKNLEFSMSGKEVLDAWLSLLNSPAVSDKRCVVVAGPQMFDIWVILSRRFHSLIDVLLKSPVVTNWGWSSLVKRAFEKNIRLFISESQSLFDSAPRIFRTRYSAALQSDTSPLPLLALHLRRGDYQEHCHMLAHGSLYTGVASLPEFEERDIFVPPEGTSEEHRKSFYNKHCYPDAEQIKQKVREVLHDYEKYLVGKSWDSWWRRLWNWHLSAPLAGKRVKKVYIMSNGDREWLNQVKRVLMADAQRSSDLASMGSRWEKSEWEFEWTWEDVGSSRELEAGWEEKWVLQVMDMYVGQRAELFVGNGFSSFTSNIVMFRKKNGFHPVQSRFW